MTCIDINECMKELSRNRPVFCSEDDFKFSLACQIKSKCNNCDIFFEFVPEYDKNVHIDIVVRHDNKLIHIELKYKTRESEFFYNSMNYNLKSHGAKNINCYKFLYDIHRVETFCETDPNAAKEGYAIFLTNDIAYTKPPKNNDCTYKDFSLEKGAIKKGKMDWATKTKSKTKKGCESPIILKGQYIIEWEKYSTFINQKNGTFMWMYANIT